MKKRWTIRTVEEWSSVANDIASLLHPGDILALQGPLGAGKTTFVQALAATMGAQKTPKSPTFSLLRTYAIHHGAIRRLLHVDAYRIDNERDLLPLALDEELADNDAVLVLEWPENVSHWLARRTVTTLHITVTATGRTATLIR